MAGHYYNVIMLSLTITVVIFNTIAIIIYTATTIIHILIDQEDDGCDGDLTPSLCDEEEEEVRYVRLLVGLFVVLL